VKRATLYTYASRGQVRVRKVGGRRKQYFAADIEALAQRSVAHAGRFPRAAAALAWGEPVLSTRISAIDRDGPYYRTIPAVDLVDRTLPELASLLWQTPPRDWPPTGAARAVDVHALRRAIDALDLPDDPVDQAHALAAYARDAADLPDHPDFTAALALCVDHELNASTFTARVVASTGADLRACVVAALAAFSGPRHGVASLGLADLLQEFEREGLSAVLEPRGARAARLRPSALPRRGSAWASCCSTGSGRVESPVWTVSSSCVGH
jgi:citrate synthase